MKYDIARLKREFSDEKVALMEVMVNTALIERVGLIDPDVLPKDFKIIYRGSVFDNEELIQLEVYLGENKLRGLLVIDRMAKTIECRPDTLCILKPEQQKPRKQSQRWGAVQRIRKEDLFN